MGFISLYTLAYLAPSCADCATAVTLALKVNSLVDRQAPKSLGLVTGSVFLLSMCWKSVLRPDERPHLLAAGAWRRP